MTILSKKHSAFCVSVGGLPDRVGPTLHIHDCVLICLWISWSAFRIVNLLVDPGQCCGSWSVFRIVNLIVDPGQCLGVLIYLWTLVSV